MDGWHQGLLDRTKALKIVTLLDTVPDPLREQLEAEAIGYTATRPPDLRPGRHRLSGPE